MILSCYFKKELYTILNINRLFGALFINLVILITLTVQSAYNYALSEALDILKRFWGYDSFRKKQDVIIQNVIDGKDTLALLPTGGGKSICYQVPGMIKDGCCLVVSPLIALMQDQVQQLKKRGIKAVAITSGMSKKEIEIQLDNAIYGGTKFLYVSPERLKTRLFKARFEKMNINLIAVDEAHCISEWGYDFRPSYLQIAELRKIKPEATFLALTATATPEVVTDIQKKLEFKQELVITDSFERSNVSYNVIQSNNKMNRIMEYLKGSDGSGIIYCSTRKGVKNLCKHLLDQGLSASFYHGGLDTETRKERQEHWISNKIQIMVCTNAFGMGIDKPDVRFVLHHDIPETIEAYFQEAGRAGRDGEFSETYLFYEPADIEELKNKVHNKYPELEAIRRVYKALGSFFQIAVGSGEGESFEIDMLEFCDRYKIDLITGYNALKFLEIGEYISLSENFNTPSKAHFKLDAKELYQYQVRNENFNKVIQFLLRTQMGIFEDLVNINEFKISKHTGLPQKEILNVLNTLSTEEALEYIPQKKGTFITYLTERLTDENLGLPVEIYQKRKTSAISKMHAMIDYLQSDVCTSVFLLNYFGEADGQECGKCNVCLNKNINSKTYDLKKDISSYLNDKFSKEESIDIQVIIAELDQYSRDEIMVQLRWMIDHDLVIADPLGKTLLKA